MIKVTHEDTVYYLHDTTYEKYYIGRLKEGRFVDGMYLLWLSYIAIKGNTVIKNRINKNLEEVMDTYLGVYND